MAGGKKIKRKRERLSKIFSYPTSHIPHPTSRYGIAFDIGTTTIVGSLVNLITCKEIATASLPNPQVRFGADVLSRIKRVMEDASNLKALQKDVIRACNHLISDLRLRVSDLKSEIKLIVAVGNSVMEHTLLGISPISLSKVPYRPVFKEAKELSARDIGLDVPPSTKMYTFPLIGGFIGGDAVGVILSTRIHKAKKPSLALDIGTNSEIILHSQGNLYAASAAAGPAFEGGRIRNGMVAQKGAIQGVNIKDDTIILDVIGKTLPIGICGTGLVDAVAEMIKTGIMDPSGRIKNRDRVGGNIANKIIEGKDGNSVLLYKDSTREITITQNDVRELQLAKGAIQAGIRLLMQRARVDDVDTIHLAGAFGSNLKKESLADIGVFEKEWVDKVVFVGDAALKGAKLAACFKGKRKEAEDIAKRIKYLSLSGSPHFQKEFIKGMEFPSANAEL